MTIGTSRRQVSAVAGVVISLVFVWYSLANLDWRIFSSSLNAVDLKWLTVFIMTLLLTMVLRAWRWHLISGLPSSHWFAVWRASCIGYAGTAIFPARAGEVMRVIHLQRSERVSTGLAIGSSVVDRLADAVAICILIGLGLALFVSDHAIEHRFFVMAGILLIAILATISFLLGGNRWGGVIFALLNRAGTIGSRIGRWSSQAFSELQKLRDWRRLSAVVGLQLVISAFDVLACWILLWAFGWTLPLTAALLTLICLAVASALPSTPGYFGVYQVAAMAALHEFGLARSEALAYGTLLQVCNFGLFLAVGIWAYSTAGPKPSRA
jgi:glycosyltransferase 2 family protein